MQIQTGSVPSRLIACFVEGRFHRHTVVLFPPLDLDLVRREREPSLAAPGRQVPVKRRGHGARVSEYTFWKVRWLCLGIGIDGELWQITLSS